MEYANLDKAFCFSKAMYYGDKCCNGVGYKKSTQNFKLHKFTIVSNICRNIKSNNYKVGNTYSFIINERGKTRKIDAPHIKDRLVHKILSNEIIEPIYTPHIIYDNGASIKNKGFKFPVYVNVRNYKRFLPQARYDATDMLPFLIENFKVSLRQQKALYLYNLIRSYRMHRWWD